LIEFYFSKENLERETHFKKLINEEGYVNWDQLNTITYFSEYLTIYPKEIEMEDFVRFSQHLECKEEEKKKSEEKRRLFL